MLEAKYKKNNSQFRENTELSGLRNKGVRVTPARVRRPSAAWLTAALPSRRDLLNQFVQGVQ